MVELQAVGLPDVSPTFRLPSARVQANPEQSKHLETARMKVLGIWVDLVNLRTESYRWGAC